MTNRTRTDVLLIAGFCAFLFFYGMGQFGLIGADEPRYAQVAREMFERHDWVTPVLGGHAWLEKPPLYYWQAMLAYSVLGVSDVAARVPAAIDATLLVIAVYLFFRRFRRGVEVDAALITASCAGMIGYAHAASMDMALAAAFSIGMLAWWAWRESGTRIYLALFYFCMALGMLAKGPVAPFLAGIVIVLFAVTARELRLVVRTLWLPGILLFCAIALPWYFAVQMQNPQFFREFILQHNLARFSSDLYHHRQPFWYYLPVAAVALVPWTVFVITAFVESARTWWAERKSVSAEPDLELQFSLFACCWLIALVVFFSISQSKLPGYILPAIPAGAILLADYLRRHVAHDQEKAEPVSKALVVVHALVAAAPIVPSVLIAYLITQHRLPAGRPMFIALALAFVLCAAIALTLASRLRLRMLRFVTLIPVVLSVAAVLKLGSVSVDQTRSARPLAVELAAVETHQLPIAVYGVSREMEYGLTFYRNQAAVRYERDSIPAEEHLLVAPAAWKVNVAMRTAVRRVLFLGNYAPQDVDYYWVGAAGPTADKELLGEEDDIREAVFRYLLTNNAEVQKQQAENTGYFLADRFLEGPDKKRKSLSDLSDLWRDRVTDPSDEFMRRFDDRKEIVHKASACRVEVFKGVVDRRTGEPGLLLLVTSIAWVSDTEVKVEGGYYHASLGSANYTYAVKKQSGKWTVTQEKMESIS